MGDDKVVAIHQPNFLPWLGYFDKIARADLFVILDDVQFPKTGGSWMNRVRLLVNGKPRWVTVPVQRAFHGTRRVDEMRIGDEPSWRGKIVETVRQSYARAAHFAAVFPIVEELLCRRTTRLVDYNLPAIRSLSDRVGLSQTEFVRAGSLAVEGRGTDRLIELVTAVGGTVYLSGDGAGGYQMDKAFPAAGLRLVHQRFQHPEYDQPNSPGFTPGLSIVDALMHCGFEGVAAFLDRGRDAAETRSTEIESKGPANA